MSDHRLPPEVFAGRRRALVEKMGAGAIAVLPAAPEALHHGDVCYPYRQDSDFQYLTGFSEPDAVAVVLTDAEKPFQLFCRPKDPKMETWHGRRAGLEGARDQYGADIAYPIAEFDQRLPELLAGREQVFFPIGQHLSFDQRLMRAVNIVRGKVRAGVRAPVHFTAIAHLLHPMRLRKTPEEIAVIREAARITTMAHRHAIQICRPRMGESTLEAAIAQTFIQHGATWAYPTIVGGGENGCILHYTENNAPLQDGDLVLIDAGAAIHGYAGDVTRTFPINGRFTGAQRDLYALVLAAQKAAIAAVRPGNHFNDPHVAAVRVLTEGLVALGLLHGDVAEIIAQEGYKCFYMHRTGHWLGMDVHDVGEYTADKKGTVFEPGMVTTIEPGLYIPTGSTTIDPDWAAVGVQVAIDVDTKWQRMGIRIEDDVLVTAQGHEILTSGAPKEVDEIEGVMLR